jgi:6-phosphogluconolactonase (cycloisomerase 2 family)
MNSRYQTWILILLIIVGLLALAGCASSGTSCSLSCTSPGGPGGGGGGGNGGGGGGGGGGNGGGGGGGGGGNGGGGGTTTSALLYYLGASSDIQGALFTSAGSFANLSPFTPPVLPSGQVNSMLVADQQFLYVPMGGFSSVAGYTIGADNSLTAIAGSPFAAAAGGDTVTTDPAGRFLFVGGQFSSSISAYQISPTTGVLTPAPGSPFRSFNLGLSSNLTVDGSGKFLYVGQSFSTSPVVAFSINQTNGALTEIAGSPFSLGVSVLQADPSGNFLLGIADNTGTSGDKHISVFSINQTTGAPTAVAGSPFATVSVPFGLIIDPNGSFVYASMADSNGVTTALEGYQLNATSGALTSLTGSPFTAFPFAFCQFEQTGAFAFCPSSTGFSVLGVDSTTGGLTHVPPDLTTTNNFPFAVTD